MIDEDLEPIGHKQPANNFLINTLLSHCVASHAQPPIIATTALGVISLVVPSTSSPTHMATSSTGPPHYGLGRTNIPGGASNSYSTPAAAFNPTAKTQRRHAAKARSGAARMGAQSARRARKDGSTGAELAGRAERGAKRGDT